MSALARFVTGHAKGVLWTAAALVVLAAVWGAGVADHLSTGGNEVPGSESVRAAAVQAANGDGSPNLIVLIGQTPQLDAAATHRAAEIADQLAGAGATITGSAFDLTSHSIPAEPNRFASSDGTRGLIVAHVPGSEAAVQSFTAGLLDTIERAPLRGDGVSVELGGAGAARLDIIETTDQDLLRAELIALPITMLLLLFFFRTPVAALLPLTVAIPAVVGTFAMLRGVTLFAEVSIFARSVASALGLAMAIDMTLFIVARYRELSPSSTSSTDAVRRAVEGAGAAVVFSGLTTAASIAGLLAFTTPLLRSFAYAGVTVVVLALIGGLFVLPAAMTVLGDRIDRWSVRPLDATGERDLWGRTAGAVMRRPIVIGAAAVIFLATLASPVLRLDFGLNDDRVLPPSASSRVVSDQIRADFPGAEFGVVSVVFEQGPPVDADQANVDRFAHDIAALPGAAIIIIERAQITVVPSVEPISVAGRTLVEQIRALDAPLPVLVGGEPARLVDNTDHVLTRLPWVLLAMMLVTGLMLGVLFRSILVPLKALALNLLSLSAMFGAIVWIFQDGRFASALGYTPTGLTDITVPTLMFAVAFGLSMDYEVYLLSRVRQHYLASHDVGESTATALRQTGRILSASAVLMAVVFLAFATSDVAHLKVLGIGITLAVLVDAFVVRTILVPALMAIAGHRNWWPGVRAPRVRPLLPE